MNIAVYAFDGISLFHLSVPQMVFDEVRRLGLGDWRPVLFGESLGPIRTAEGYTIEGTQGLGAVDAADIVVIPSWTDDARPVPPSVHDSVLGAHRSGAMVVGLCLGAIAVSDMGLLTGRSAATHWHAVESLRARHPDISVDADKLYVDHGDVLTSAGTASGIDACLHIVRTRLGAEAANRVARSLVVAPHREGGQAQYIERPIPSDTGEDPIARASAWALDHLDDDLSVDRLAAAARMSRRSFARLFRMATGATPAAWIRARRLDEARRLLEMTDLPIDRIAASCGFTPVTFRQNFAATFGSTPSGYRARFDARQAAAD